MTFFSEFKPHIVQFNDGTYAIRKRVIPFGELKYMNTWDNYWWSYGNRKCAATTLEEVTKAFDILNKPIDKDAGKPV